MFPHIPSVHLGYLACWYTVVYRILFQLHKVGSNVPTFIHDFSNLSLLSFFLGHSWLRFVSFTDLFKELIF